MLVPVVRLRVVVRGFAIVSALSADPDALGVVDERVVRRFGVAASPLADGPGLSAASAGPAESALLAVVDRVRRRLFSALEDSVEEAFARVVVRRRVAGVPVAGVAVVSAPDGSPGSCPVAASAASPGSPAAGRRPPRGPRDADGRARPATSVRGARSARGAWLSLAASCARSISSTSGGTSLHGSLELRGCRCGRASGWRSSRYDWPPRPPPCPERPPALRLTSG